MNIRNYFLGACAALAFTACTGSEDIAAVQQPVWDEYGNGYLSFSVQLPTDNSSRGVNDDFDPGLASEYKVNNVALLLFKGATEETAEYQQFVDMSDIDFGDPHAGNITLDKKYVAKIHGMDLNTSDKVWALAVINRNKVFDHTNNTIGGVDMAGKTFAYLRDQIVVNTNLTANGDGEGQNAALQTPTGGILMLNAPLSDTKGTAQGLTNEQIKNAKYTTLQDVTSSIFATENEARQGACSNIYVERAVAKVTVEYTSSEGSNSGFSWTFNQWALDNTNTKSFVVRNMANFRGVDGFVNPVTNTVSNIPVTFNLKSHSLTPAASVYRMIGGSSVYHDAPISAGAADKNDRFRTYFAIDPNYNEPGVFNEYTTSVGNNRRNFGAGNPMYCAENVFDVDHQIWKETTRVLVSVELKYKNGDTFYAHPGDEKFLTEDAVKELAYNAAIKNYRDAIKKYRDAGLLAGSIDPTSTGVTMSISKGTNGIQNDDKVTVTLPTNNITVGSTVTNAMVEAAGIKDANDDPITTVAQVESDLAVINKSFAKQEISHAAMGVRYYHSGVSYYQVRIKHFGDDYTPWNADEDNDGAGKPSAGGITSAYPTGDHRACNYLGRYGVLRNNWYMVRLSDVIKIGYPTLDELDLTPAEPGTPGAPEDPIDPNTPDDHIDKEQWINAEVNILSWAKRLQSNILGDD